MGGTFSARLEMEVILSRTETGRCTVARVGRVTFVKTLQLNLQCDWFLTGVSVHFFHRCVFLP